MKVDAFKKVNRLSRHSCKYIKKQHVIYAAFKQVQNDKYPKNKISSLKIPGKTRWGSIVMTLKSVIQNKEALQYTVLKADLQIDQKIKKYILDDSF